MGSCSIVVVIVVVLVLLDRGLATDGQAAGDIGTWRGTRDGHGPSCAIDWGTNRHVRGQRAMGCVEAGLDEVLALGLGDEWLELGGGEGVD